MMRGRAKSLLTNIEQAGLSSEASLPDALRMCVALGGQAGSKELREWASRELRGYRSEGDVPEYRRLAAPIRIDGVTGNPLVGGAKITGQRISPGNLPDVVAERIGEEVHIRHPISQIDELSRKGEPVKLSLPMGADIVRLMNDERDDSLSAIQNVYWSVAPSALASIVDQVRTRLVELIAEMRAGLDDDAQIPSAALADQAVGVVIRGDSNRVVVNSAQSSAEGNASVAAARGARRSPGKLLFGVLVGLATIAAAVFGGVQLLD